MAFSNKMHNKSYKKENTASLILKPINFVHDNYITVPRQRACDISNEQNYK